jgi:hypothetical protein
MTAEYNDILTPPKKSLKHGDDTIEVDNITATLKISRQELTDAMKRLYELTNADKFSIAANLVWYKFDPGKDKRTADMVSMITTLYRCAKDGSIKPPVDLDEFYAEVNNLTRGGSAGMNPSMNPSM